MARRSEVWQAPAETTQHLPEISGNTVNGLGEEERRPPSPFFWHIPEYHDFEAMQIYTIQTMYGLEDGQAVFEAFRMNPEFRPDLPSDAKSNPQFVHRGPDPIEIAAHEVDKPAAQWSEEIKAFALSHHADLVGIARMRPQWIYEGFEIKEKYVVVMGFGHDYEEIAQAPPLPGNNRAVVEIGKQYTRGAMAAAELTNFIRGQGHVATSFPGPTADALLMIPAAIEAGLGELGKHGSMINRKFGSSFRLSAVTTDMPLIPDEPDDFGADEVCASCQVCVDACPPDAIFSEKQMVRGERKWYVDFDKCIPYFAESRSCGICIAKCPYSLPGVADNLILKMARRKAKREDG